MLIENQWIKQDIRIKVVKTLMCMEIELQIECEVINKQVLRDMQNNPVNYLRLQIIRTIIKEGLWEIIRDSKY